MSRRLAGSDELRREHSCEHPLGGSDGGRQGRDQLDFQCLDEASSGRGEQTFAVGGDILWDSGPEARARLVAQGDALRALVLVARSREAEADRS